MGKGKRRGRGRGAMVSHTRSNNNTHIASIQRRGSRGEGRTKDKQTSGVELAGGAALTETYIHTWCAKKSAPQKKKKTKRLEREGTKRLLCRLTSNGSLVGSDSRVWLVGYTSRLALGLDLDLPNQSKLSIDPVAPSIDRSIDLQRRKSCGSYRYRAWFLLMLRELPTRLQPYSIANSLVVFFRSSILSHTNPNLARTHRPATPMDVFDQWEGDRQQPAGRNPFDSPDSSPNRTQAAARRRPSSTGLGGGADGLLGAVRAVYSTATRCMIDYLSVSKWSDPIRCIAITPTPTGAAARRRRLQPPAHRPARHRAGRGRRRPDAP